MADEPIVEPKADEKQEKTFTQAEHQAELDRVVAERLAREREKFKDYDDLKAKADGAKSVEEKLAELEKRHAEAEARALRSTIAAEFGISTKKGAKGEPSDADLLLTGSDEATMRAQAERVGQAVADRKKQGNVAPKEGTPTNVSGDEATERQFASALFGGGD